ncbi:hypothetical protein MIR68_000139 [Amoeboaphelidium protococcarum]|nr:hypothetical protein MIR68_000139 [Amoeboaphelidium protococcarum]
MALLKHAISQRNNISDGNAQQQIQPDGTLMNQHQQVNEEEILRQNLEAASLNMVDSSMELIDLITTQQIHSLRSRKYKKKLSPMLRPDYVDFDEIMMDRLSLDQQDDDAFSWPLSPSGGIQSSSSSSNKKKILKSHNSSGQEFSGGRVVVNECFISIKPYKNYVQKQLFGQSNLTTPSKNVRFDGYDKDSASNQSSSINQIQSGNRDRAANSSNNHNNLQLNTSPQKTFTRIPKKIKNKIDCKLCADSLIIQDLDKFDFAVQQAQNGEVVSVKECSCWKMVVNEDSDDDMNAVGGNNNNNSNKHKKSKQSALKKFNYLVTASSHVKDDDVIWYELFSWLRHYDFSIDKGHLDGDFRKIWIKVPFAQSNHSLDGAGNVGRNSGHQSPGKQQSHGNDQRGRTERKRLLSCSKDGSSSSSQNGGGGSKDGKNRKKSRSSSRGKSKENQKRRNSSDGRSHKGSQHSSADDLSNMSFLDFLRIHSLIDYGSQ